MTVSEMRELVSSVYAGQKWKDRVKYMSDDQVIAIYWQFVKKGKLG